MYLGGSIASRGEGPGTGQRGLGIGTRNGRGKGRSTHPSQPWCAPRPLPSRYQVGDARTGRAQTAAMAPVARGLPWGPAFRGWGAAVFVWVFLRTLCTAPASAIQVTVSDPYHVVILFQPVTLPCTYQLTTTPTAPIVIWKYKSFCRDRIADAFSPTSADNQLNAQLAAGNPGYNPYVECQDSMRTVRVVATKQGNAVTLGDYYQGRRITITGSMLGGAEGRGGACWGGDAGSLCPAWCPHLAALEHQCLKRLTKGSILPSVHPFIHLCFI
ncbi:lipolysis-stimulated lipoprotein receptor [Leptonychotes weddellii]|uniref:Lipolysis-stimulated lipoprotein receptor n=1 Tax=Leptonychotes weddellii TaxID=9713 RepID=A0A7F8QLP4_LEPWE|nr:lipolysis-stimulated lipoprotein receptor [Leptonychotes weddellii]